MLIFESLGVRVVSRFTGVIFTFDIIRRERFSVNPLNLWFAFNFLLVALRLISMHHLHKNLNFAPFSRELERIRLQVHKHLLDSFLIRLNEQTLVLKRNILDTLVLWGQCFFGLETNELRNDLYSPTQSLVLLDGSDIIDCSLNVKRFDILYELTRFQLGVTQNIFNI